MQEVFIGLPRRLAVNYRFVAEVNNMQRAAAGHLPLDVQPFEDGPHRIGKGFTQLIKEKRALAVVISY